MKKMSIALLGTCGLVVSATCYAAAGGVEKIQAYLNHDIKFTINNESWIPKDGDDEVLTPIILDGTSYIPVKAVVEAIGGEVQWNEDTKTIAISSVNERNSNTIPQEISETERNTKIMAKVSEVKLKLKIGMTKEEVEAIFKERFENAEVNGDLENGSDSYWKYDLFKTDDYKRPSDIPDHIIDEEGLKNKKIGAHLFIGWKNNQLHLYSISYVNPEDNQVYLFVMNSDGTTSESPINS